VTTPRPIVAVVPFGAQGRDAQAGVIGRQVARRLVDRFADDPSVELRPVFLVAMPEAKSDAGYLVFGSTPDPDLAVRYGESLGTTHALTGLYREDEGGRAFSVTVVDVAARRAVASRELAVAEGELHRAEPTLAAWLVAALGVPAQAGLDQPETANEAAYRALLGGLEEEVNATLLREGDPVAADAARVLSFQLYVAAIRADPESLRAEDRLLVLAAESVERGDEERAARALEEVIEAKPMSWRSHYMLAELLRQIGETNHAIVALEHAHALRPLRDVDVMMLAELYVAEGAPGQAAAHLRRIAAGSASFGRAQEVLGVLALGKGDHEAARTYLERAVANGRPTARTHLARANIAAGRIDDARRALGEIISTGTDADAVAQARRLRLGLERPDLEADLERAGRAALSANPASYEEVRAAFAAVLAFDQELWEAHFGLGLVARKVDDFKAAAISFRRALELTPGQPDVLHELGVALLASGSQQEALALLDQAASLRPRDAGYLADSGFAHLRMGDLGAARERLRMARAIDADDPLTQAYLVELERAEAATGKAN
jgi:Tfp pilus assembly protein PilF